MGFSFYSQRSGCGRSSRGAFQFAASSLLSPALTPCCRNPLECKMAFVLRIKFPPTYPLIYKTLRVDSELSVEEAIQFIGETLHVPAGENIGLYLPAEKQWLDAGTPLKEYPVLEDVEEIEFKDRNAPEPEPQQTEAVATGGCCTIM